MAYKSTDDDGGKIMYTRSASAPPLSEGNWTSVRSIDQGSIEKFNHIVDPPTFLYNSAENKDAIIVWTEQVFD
jgi:hypothetical protein